MKKLQNYIYNIIPVQYVYLFISVYITESIYTYTYIHYIYKSENINTQ